MAYNTYYGFSGNGATAFNPDIEQVYSGSYYYAEHRNSGVADAPFDVGFTKGVKLKIGRGRYSFDPPQNHKYIFRGVDTNGNPCDIISIVTNQSNGSIELNGQATRITTPGYDLKQFTVTIDWGNNTATLSASDGSETQPLLQSATGLQSGIETVRLNNDTSSGTPAQYVDDIEYDTETYTIPPAAPQNVAIDYNGAGDVVVNWSINNSEGEVSGHDVQISVDGSGYQTVASVGASVSSYTWSGASTPENTYQARVVASNSAESATSDPSATVATNVQNLSVTGHDADSVSLSWNNVDQEGGYNIYRSESTPVTTGDTLAGSTGANVTTYTDTGLENGEQYHYAVAAVYGSESDALSNEVTETTTLPALTDVVSTPGLREVALSWTVADNSPDGDILVEQKPTGGSWSTLTTLDDDATSYTDSGLLDGEEYQYRLTRRTDHEETSTTSSAVTTDLPAPTNLTVANVTASSADLSWTASHNYGDTLVQIKPVGGSWETVATVSRTTESYALSLLRNGEQYQTRVRAATEYTKTTDQ